MNIAEELLDIATKCDMYKLYPEADILTEIAKSFLNGQNPQTIQDMAEEEAQNLNTQEQTIY